MRHPIEFLALASVLFCGAIFGFFYAWVCSTMWGLDAADPRTAISAMQAMNASVRNIVFAPAFFGTAPLLLVTAFATWRMGASRAALLFAAAGIVYLCFGQLLTMGVNVPMNRALAALAVPEDVAAARALWDDYSGDWQFWNTARTVASGISLLLAAAGTALLGRTLAMRQSASQPA